MVDRRVRAEDLEGFTAQVFEGLGMPPADAATEAEVLIWANLRGVDSHGVTRLESYQGAIDAGSMNVRPGIRVLSERAGAIFIEGDNAMGPVVTSFAVDRVAEKARAAGVGWGLIRNTTHQGAMGYYVEKLALQGLAGIAVVCNPPNMAPPGAKAAGTHNSPIAFAVPSKERGALIFDMATSIVAFGRVMVAADQGVPLGDDWALDADGQPTTDPALAKFLRPAGGYKGYGLALMFECFTSLMAGNALLAPHILPDRSDDKAKRGAQNSFIAAVDVSMFSDVDEMRAEVDELIRAEKSLPTLDGVDEIMVPGDPQQRTLEDRSANGIPLPPGTWDKIVAAAQRLDLELPTEVGANA
ncbi:MAG TPA: lactate dehydrogenase [Candidatus Latescibacteria bacterium]|nr:lactate dehydrogenase [Candidatus Latescibacterota bacterium]